MGTRPELRANVSSAAETTPTSYQEPIGRAAAVFREIVFRVLKPSHYLSKYTIAPRRVEIACRLNFLPHGHKDLFRVLVAGDEEVIEVSAPISREEFGKLRSIEVWAEPYGHAALRETQPGKLAVGKLSFQPPTSAQLLVGTSRPRTLAIDVEVLKGVVPFIVDEMNQNLADDTVATCRVLNERADTLHARAQLEARRLDLRAAASTAVEKAAVRGRAWGLWTARVHTASGRWGHLPGGDWDHKQIISPVWGAKNRLGDSEDFYYYDIWSNLHFGYVGHAAGFSLDVLTLGADVQQVLDSFGLDDPTDVEAIKAGFALYGSGALSIADVLALLKRNPQWLYENRKKKNRK